MSKYPTTQSPNSAKRYMDDVYPGEITLDGETVVLRLDHDAAEWLAGELERHNRNDIFTNALWWYVYEIKKQLISKEPG